MKTEEDLFNTLSEKWILTEKEIYESYSELLKKNKEIHEKPFDSHIKFNETEKTLLQSINTLDQLIINSMMKKTLLVKCILTLLTAWHENYDQPAMLNVSNRFSDHEITTFMKTSKKADLAISDVINNLRQLVMLIIVNSRK